MNFHLSKFPLRTGKFLKQPIAECRDLVAVGRLFRINDVVGGSLGRNGIEQADQPARFQVVDRQRDVMQARTALIQEPAHRRRGIGRLQELERGAAGETVNLCSGKGTTTRHVLDTLLAVAGLTGKVEVEQAPSRIRPVEVPSLVGDPSYVEQLLGKEHSPATPLETTLKDTLLWWEKRLESDDKIPTGVPA